MDMCGSLRACRAHAVSHAVHFRSRHISIHSQKLYQPRIGVTHNTLHRTYSVQCRAAGAAADVSSASAPGEVKDVDKEEEERSAIKLAVSVLRPDLPLLILISGVLIATTSATLAFPLAIGDIFDAVRESVGINNLAAAGITMVDSIKIAAKTAPEQFKSALTRLCTCLILSAAGNASVFYLAQVLAERFGHRMRQRLMSDIVSKPQKFFDATPKGDLVNRLSSEVTTLQNTLADCVGQRGFRSLLEVLCSVVVIARKDPMLALFSFAVVPTLSRLLRIIVAKAAALTVGRQKAQTQAMEFANVRLTYVRTVQLFAQEDRETKDFAALVGQGFTMARKVAIFQGMVEGAGRLAVNAGTVALLGFGGYLVLQGRISVGSLLAFNIYNLFISVGLSSVAGSLGDIGKAAGALQRIAQVATTDKEEDTKQEPETEAAAEEEELQKQTEASTSSSESGCSIEFRGVWFRYDGREGWALRDFSLKVPAGSMVALVGPSGSGKTTASALLLGLYGPPQKGTILIDGIPLTEETLPALRPRMAAVLQQSMLMSGSVSDVIRMGAIDATDDEVKEAAVRANADLFVMELPERYDTQVGERGGVLSGGQKQRLSLARALVRKPKLLVLDEATSALDVTSERAVCDAFRSLQHCTRVMIAHRLSTVLAADTIAVVRDGGVVEQGTHAQLIDHGGEYRRMVQAGETDGLWEPEGEEKGAQVMASAAS